MTDSSSNNPLLEITKDERAALKKVAAAGEAPHSQRALAILALAEGADLAGAGITADLTVNQVRYWLGRFRPRRLTIFPEEVLAVQEEEPPMLAAPEKAPMLEAPDIAGELPEAVPDSAEVAVAVAAAKSKKKGKKSKSGKKKKKSGGKKKSKKNKKSKKSGKNKKDDKKNKSKKGKKEKKGDKDKKSKKGKKDKKVKKDKKSKKKK